MIFAMEDEIGEYSEAWEIQPPHNYYLNVAVEQGIQGLILFIAFFVLLVKMGIDQLKSSTVARETLTTILLLSIFMSFLFLMLFDHYFYTLWQTQLLLWIIIGMIIGLNKHKDLGL